MARKGEREKGLQFTVYTYSTRWVAGRLKAFGMGIRAKQELVDRANLVWVVVLFRDLKKKKNKKEQAKIRPENVVYNVYI